jgi:hypothetical protein
MHENILKMGDASNGETKLASITEATFKKENEESNKYLVMEMTIHQQQNQMVVLYHLSRQLHQKKINVLLQLT